MLMAAILWGAVVGAALWTVAFLVPWCVRAIRQARREAIQTAKVQRAAWEGRERFYRDLTERDGIVPERIVPLPDGGFVAAWCDACGVLGGHYPGCQATTAGSHPWT